MRLLRRIIDHRFWPLFMKELRQIKRNHKLVVMLIMPPTVNLVLLGFAMNPEVRDLRLGVVDESRTAESRALISAFVEGRSFRAEGQYASAEGLGRALSEGGLDAGLVIPHDFAAMRARGDAVEVQILVDSVNSNTAGIAAGYASRVVAAHGRKGAAAGGRRSRRGRETPGEAAG